MVQEDRSPWELIYGELKKMAHMKLRREGRNMTLSTTGLVHEVYIRLADETALQGHDNVDERLRMFYGYASRAMRQILVDLARRRNARKRNNGVRNATLNEELVGNHFDLSGFDAELMIDIDRLMGQLEDMHPRWSKVVECIYFGGMTQAETAKALDVSSKTVERDWNRARNWLFNQMNEQA